MNSVQSTDNHIIIPTLAMRGIVLFEGMTMHFDVGRKKSIAALNYAMENDRKIFLVTQKDISVDNPNKSDLYSIGVVANVIQLLKTSDDVVRVFVKGIYRAKLIDVISTQPFLEAIIKKHPIAARSSVSADEIEATMRVVKNEFEIYGSLIPKMSKELILSALSKDDPKKLFEAIAFNLVLRYEDKQALLSQNSTYKRLRLLADILHSESDIMSLEHEIYEQVKEQIDKNQREYFLREQMKAISYQLGEDDSQKDETADFKDKIAKLKNISQESKEKLFSECDKLSKMPASSQEASVIRSYLEACLALPWDISTKDTANIAKAKKILDRDHYGLTKVKERILEILAVRQLVPDIKGQIICLVGPPGVGKTSIGKSIAETLGRKYVRVSLGGVKDESDIRGHRKTYVGAMPGRIITAIKQAKSNNPLILLDEIDKMGADFKGDPSSAMLEVLDSEQNYSFRDHYIEIPFDLSDVLFITTANDASMIPAPLRDRMELIELSSYTREEKFNIAKRHLVPKQVKKHGLSSKDITFLNEGIYCLIDSYTREAGVRNLEREIAGICRKGAKLKVSDNFKKVRVNEKLLKEFLGPKKYSINLASQQNQIGVVTGLAWTSVGGETMELEAVCVEGSGKIKVTGNLGDVMKESASLAVTNVRTLAKEYNIPADFYKTMDIHIHAGEGAVPKDGPSAGITMTTALLSALSGIPVNSKVAMTGEISLRGKVMQIGGLKEKSIAAFAAGIKTVIIPYDNKPDIDTFDDIIKENINFIPVKTIKEVLDIALIMPDKSNEEKFFVPDTTDNYSELTIRN